MAHVVYIHINNYGVLKNVGMRFDSHFGVRVEMLPQRDYEFHLTHFKLTIERTVGVPEGFYGDHIQGLTAIVGNNGAGKTTALRFLLEAVVSGAGHDISGLVVTEEGGQLHVYHSEEIRIERDDDCLNFQEEGGWPEIDAFVYGGHVNILSRANDIMSMEWQGMVNAAEGFLLAADLQHYGREMAENGYFPLRDYATAYDVQNQWRICNFLANYDGELTRLLQLPEYVLVLPNKAGLWSLKHRLNEATRIDFPALDKPRDWTFREFRLAEIIYYSIINYIADDIGEREAWQDYQNSWQQTVTEHYNGDVVWLFRQFVDSRRLSRQNQYRVLLENICEVIESVNHHCDFEEGSLLHFFFFRTDNDNMRTFVRWIQTNPIFITSRYFDLRYAHYYDGDSILSSGEKAMLDMYSRIYDTLITKHQHDSNYRWPTLFVFDEAEIGFHPEWQRQYVKNITVFLENMACQASALNREYYNNAPDFRYQIILTSHSPVILSDIPRESAVMLRRGNNGLTRNVSESRQQTFGTNIFELYRDSFFMEGGLVGEFAQEYIHSLSEEIDGMRNPEVAEVENLRKRIDLIGDRNIREYLIEQLEPKMEREVLIEDYQQRIRHYQQQIERLQNEQN